MFHQPDLFDQPMALAPKSNLPDLVDRVSLVSKRPRYALLVLKLIAQGVGHNDSIGPYVRSDEGRMPVRDWLCQALAPLAQRDCRRLAMVEAVRAEVRAKLSHPDDSAALDRAIEEEVRARIMRSGRTSVSRAVSDLVRAGLLRRHYQGYRVDHHNRGAQREAVYTIMPEVRRAFSRH